MLSMGEPFGPLFAAPPAAPSVAVIDEPAETDDTSTIDVFARAVVLQLQFRRLGTHRKVSADDINTNATGADKALLRVTKLILDAPELKAIEKHDGETARFIDARKSGPAFANQGGFHLIALDLKDGIDRWLDERLTEREALIETFLSALLMRINDTAARLGALANDIRYPTPAEAREAFGVTRRYMTFGYDNPEAAAEWKREALGECRQALRGAFAEVVSHLADRLTPGVEGKPKTFRDSLVTRFDDFVASFNARNLADDRELAALVTQARAIMAGVSPTDLRKREGLRAAVATQIATIKAAIDQLVIDKPTRLYGED